MSKEDHELFKLLNELIRLEDCFPDPSDADNFLIKVLRCETDGQFKSLTGFMEKCHEAAELLNNIKKRFSLSVLSPIFNQGQRKIAELIVKEQKLRHEYFYDCVLSLFEQCGSSIDGIRLQPFEDYADDCFINSDYSLDYHYAYGYTTWLVNKQKIHPVTSTDLPKDIELIHNNIKECFGLCLWLPCLALSRTLIEVAVKGVLNKYKILPPRQRKEGVTFAYHVNMIPDKCIDKYLKNEIVSLWNRLSGYVHLDASVADQTSESVALDQINATVRYVNRMYRS